MKTKVDMNKVMEEVEAFREEYPDYTDEHVSEYMQLLDDFTRAEKEEFATQLGY